MARESAEVRLEFFLQHADYAVMTKTDDSIKLNWEHGDAILDMSIDELNLSVRSWNCLKRAGIDTVGTLIDHTSDELASSRNLGRRSFEEIVTKLDDLGLKLNEYTYVAK